MKVLRLRNIPVLVFLLLAVALMSATTNAQRRDYLTEDEVELVRDAQQIDLRMKVLTKAIDRRFEALGIHAGGMVTKGKSEQWGPEPTGTRLELLDDIHRIIQKAVDDIDNLAERPDSIVVEDPDASKKEKPKKYEDVFPPAVRILAAAAKRYEPLLRAALETTKDEHERGVIIQTGDLCEEIIAAETRLKTPPPAEKKSGSQ